MGVYIDIVRKGKNKNELFSYAELKDFLQQFLKFT